MEFDLPAALAAGFAATVVMTALMTMAARAGMTDMPPMPLVTGAMMTGDRRRAVASGAVVHYLVMGTAVFGLLYGALFAAFDEASSWTGALIGAAHGLVVGAIFMPMMPTMHPRMSRSAAPVRTGLDRATVTEQPDGEVRLAAPGFMGKDWGAMTPGGLVMGHAVYGVVAALVYSSVV